MLASCTNGTLDLDARLCHNDSLWQNVSDDSGIDTWAIQRIVSTVVPIFFTIIGLAGLLGNALVVLVVALNPGMRSTTNILIINLAVADLLFVIFCIPFTATDYVLTAWPFGDLWCKIVQYLIVVTAHASVYTLVLMSLDRFLAVVHPIASMSVRNERYALRAILLTWTVILTTAIPVALSHGEVRYSYGNEGYSSCVFLESAGYSRPAFHISFFASSYVMPLTLISFLYMRMLARLWRGPIAVGAASSRESRRGKRRVTRLVVVVVAAFAICWAPIQVLMFLLKLFNDESIKYFIILIFSIGFQRSAS
ncbi:allatostatin-A receptor-like [Ctenocephalides felis]|uniref:allatostatin-A receptor-like n=1 Tax=Ctenocephalides felis TaxID=7515 RepID=UPI000E6E1429|nr:allatostatin-A receptor-like [Ctenocephalides felis]